MQAKEKLDEDDADNRNDANCNARYKISSLPYPSLRQAALPVGFASASLA
jgi:hypothetical protein